MINEETLKQWEFEASKNESYSEGQRIRELITEVRNLRKQNEVLREGLKKLHKNWCGCPEMEEVIEQALAEADRIGGK